MTLTAKDVAEITRLLEESHFDELYLEVDGLKLSLRRGNGTAAVETRRRPNDASPPPAPAAADESMHAVTAPLLGTFYRAPKPGAPPFIEVGSAVAKDTVIGIIEVMKLMNTVRAGVNGAIVEILAQDGTLVEYGEALLRVRKTAAA